MNAAGQNAIRSALANVEDNLYRYSHFAKPTDLTGNGETVSSIIVRLENERDALRSALHEVSDVD